MNNTISFDERGFIEIIVHGVTSQEETMSIGLKAIHLTNQLTLRGEKKNLLFNLRESDGLLDEKAFSMTAKGFRDLELDKLALVVKEDEDTEEMQELRTLIKISEKNGTRVQNFSDREEALSWLLEQDISL